MDDARDPADVEGRMRFLSAAVEQCGEGIAVSDLEGVLLFVNRAFAAMHGYRPGELVGRHLSIFHTPEQLPAVDEANRLVRETGEFKGEVWHARRDGSVFPSRMHNTLLLGEDGSPVGMIGTVCDITERKRAEDALEESMAKYRAVVEAFDGLLCICSRDYRVKFANRRLAEQVGRDPVGEKCHRAIYGLEAVCPWCASERVFGGKTVRWDIRSPKDGRWYHVVNTPIDHPDGALSRMAMIHDVTERQRSEMALRDRVERVVRQQAAVLALTRVDLSDLDSALRAIAETDAKTLGVERVGIWMFSDDLSEIVCVEHYDRSGGTHERGKRMRVEGSPSYFRAVEESRFLCADDALSDPRTRELAGDWLIPSGITSTLDAVVRLRGKRAGLIRHGHVGPPRRWRLDEQEFVGSMADMVSMALASSEHLRVEKELMESERRFRDIADNIPEWIWEVDREGKYTYAGPAVEKILGYGPAEVLGRPFYDFFHPEDGERIKRVALEMFATKRPFVEFENRNLHKSGRTVWLSTSGVPILDPAGRLLGYRGADVDITERKRAEVELKCAAEELRRSNRDLGEFATVAAHDLQEPLHITVSFLRLLERRHGESLDAGARELLLHAVEGSRRMQTLIKDLLSYSRVGSRGRALKPASGEEAVRRALDHLGAAVRECGAEVTHGPLPTVRADELQLVQLFQNLIGNAIKFCDASPPRVHISAGREGDEWVFSVRDNGIGIAPEHAEHIFQVFRRLHTPGEHPGTGVGLAIGKKIVERHGGRIWAESAPGKGSTFRFTLPVREEG